MSVRYCTRCRKPYGEALEGVANVAPNYAPFCSKRCADVDLVHWLKGDYAISGTGELTLSEDADGDHDDADATGNHSRHTSQDDEQA